MNCYRIYSDRQCNTVVENDEFKEGFVNIYILQRKRLNCTSSICQTIIRENPEDDVVFTIGEDGYYILCRIVLSTNPEDLYYYSNRNIYHQGEEIELQDLINLSPEEVDITYEDYFQLCYLRKCLVKICKDILNNTTSIECNLQQNNSELSYRRDLIWTAFNVINYMIEMGQYEEAERLLLRISGCNGLCDNLKTNCGCGNVQS